MSTTTALAGAKPARTGRAAKPHVPSACTNCKKAHLACDLQRPCQRCVNSGRCDSCKDVQHKKRGRPRTKDKRATAAEQSPMETQMFQFSFATAPQTPVSGSPMPASPIGCSTPDAATQPMCASLSPDTIACSAPSGYDASMHRTAPGGQTMRACGVPGASEKAAASYLFLTPALLCLRLEEISSSPLLGYSLLSLINRSALDFVSDCDRSRVVHMFETIKMQISSRLAKPPSRAYSHAILGCAPPAVDPNTFQAVPVDRLLQRVCSGIGGDVRAHLRTVSGGFDLFDIHVYVGAVPRSPAAELAYDEAYLVCRITKYDALSCTPSPGLVPQIAVPRVFGDNGSICLESLDTVDEPSAKRQRTSFESNDALFLLAAVTGRDAAASSDRSDVSSKQSTVPSSPVLATPSPSLSADSPRSGVLPPLSDLLKSLNTDLHFSLSMRNMSNTVAP
ncbi:hypothetical protein IW136_003713 [Coemansia sp. RSA 678]|nr:hypothetical protein IW136_003713 [Coemansia sp. RSA 678]